MKQYCAIHCTTSNFDDGYPILVSMTPKTPPPVRKRISHAPPLQLNRTEIIYFVTICSEARATDQFVPRANLLLDSARHYQLIRRWFLHLFLIMPDHLHMLVQVTAATPLPRVVADWKRYLSHMHGIRFQREIFETRIRDAEHFAEKWRYILFNPVTRGIVSEPRAWPHVISFNPVDGRERVHKGPRPA